MTKKEILNSFRERYSRKSRFGEPDYLWDVRSDIPVRFSHVIEKELESAYDARSGEIEELLRLVQNGRFGTKNRAELISRLEFLK